MYKKFPLNIDTVHFNILVTNSTNLNKSITEDCFVLFCPADDVDTFVKYVYLISSFLHRVVELKPYDAYISTPDIHTSTTRLYQASKLDFSIVAPQQTGRLVNFKEDFIRALYKAILYSELAKGLSPFEGEALNDQTRARMVSVVEQTEVDLMRKFKDAIGVSTVIFYKVDVSFEGSAVNIDMPQERTLHNSF